MSLDRALEVAREVGDECLEDVGLPFGEQALEAAAVLKDEDKVAYARLQADIKASNADTNAWKADVKEKQRELSTGQRRKGDHRPIIEDRADLHLMVDESVDALAQLGHIYERGGELVEIVEGIDGPEMRPIQKGRIRELLSRAARFERVTNDGAKSIKPPPAVVDSVHARGQWGLPALEGFVDGAAMLENGDILCTEGYHPDARLFVRHAVEVSGLKSPTKEDAKSAREHITDLLVDFELVEDKREAHEAAWLAAFLTILARPAIGPGCTPLFLFDANSPGVGKTRLAEIACELATGRSPNPQAAPSGRDSDSEMRKTITGIARSGNPIVFFDNVKGKLGGSSLELAITARRWSARILGESKTYEGRLMLTWLATSNNCRITSDLKRRTLLVRIETTSENPEKRTGFKYPSIMSHVREHRAEYLKSALTILRAWHVAGQPTHGLTPWGSFEEWGHIIRNSIIYAGGADPCGTRDELADTDSVTSRLEAVLEAWPLETAFRASEIAQAMSDGYFKGGLQTQHHELAEALMELLPSKKASSIGTLLGYHKKKVIGGRRLVQGTGRERRSWLVEEV
ncbi:MAG: hypothetical protein ACLFVJ_18870 [Persicimonas sp.]